MPSYQASDPITTESRGVDESGVERNLKEIKTPPHPLPFLPLLPTHSTETWVKEKFWDHLNGGWTEASDWLISCTVYLHRQRLAVMPNHWSKTTDVYLPAAVGCPEGSFERVWIKREKHDNQPCFIDNNGCMKGPWRTEQHRMVFSWYSTETSSWAADLQENPPKVTRIQTHSWVQPIRNQVRD